jgi:hypothetical protein
VQAAKAFDVTLRTYRRYELGGRPKQWHRLHRFICQHGLSFNFVFGGKGPIFRRA